MQKEKSVPAKTTIVVLLFFFLWCNKAIGQAPIKMNKEDSIAAQKYIDSLEKNVSMYDFKIWSDANAAGRKTDFDVLQGFYTFYLQTRFNQWLQQRKKPK